jgi:hypothetical protein
MVRSFSARQVNALIREFRWPLCESADATFALRNGKRRIEQLVDLLHGQIFNFNRISPGGAKATRQIA